MINPETNKSKGYAFIEFTNYKEFQTALNYPEPIILGKQKLVFNSAKNRYDSNQNDISENVDNPNINNNNIQISNSINNNDFNHSNYLLTNNKDNINIRISGISDGSTNNSSTNSSYNSASLGIKQKENFSKLETKKEDSPFSIQIKYALKNMANFYGKNNPFFCKSKICNYYCGPFLEKEIFDSNHEAVFNGSSMNQV
jgi:RNA recognition motif-containing protein